MHFFAHVDDDDEPAPEPEGVLHDGVRCDVCCGDVRGARYVSLHRSNAHANGHLSTYDVCAVCKKTPAAEWAAPYVVLEAPNGVFTPWPKSACPCSDCKGLARTEPPPPADQTHRCTGVTLAPTAAKAAAPEGGCCVVS